MSERPPSARGPGRWLDTCVLAAVLLALVVVLRQDAIHGLDAQHLIGMVRDHGDLNYSHPLYLPLMHRWHALLAPLGCTPFESLRLASGLGVVLGAIALHRAGLALGLPRAPALVATALACSVPAVVFFATVVELHGVFLAPAGIAFWLWASANTATDPRTRARRFAALGVATAVASGVHTSGHFLLWLLPALTAGFSGRRPPWRSFALTLGVHALVSVSLTFLLRTPSAGGGAGLGAALADAFAYWAPRVPWAPHEVAALLWREWVFPFLPLSLATCAALAVRAQRRFALLLLVGIAPLLGLSWLLLHRELYERGAYLLPFAWPGALLVTCWWRPRHQLTAIGVALALAIGQVVVHDRVEDDLALRQTMRGAIGPHPALLICLDAREVDQAVRDLPTVTPRPIHLLAPAILAGYDALCAEFDAWVAPHLAAGASVWLTPRAKAVLDLMEQPAVARFKREHLVARYRLEPIADPGCPAVRVLRR